MSIEQKALIHADVLQLGDEGVLILGESGAGKSLLTLTLIERAPSSGRTACLVADDYCELTASSGKLVARAPASICGAIEIRGAGLFTLPYQQQVTLSLVVELVAAAPRYPENHQFSRFGVTLPCLHLPRLDGNVPLLAVCHAIEAYLFLPPYLE